MCVSERGSNYICMFAASRWTILSWGNPSCLSALFFGDRTQLLLQLSDNGKHQQRRLLPLFPPICLLKNEPQTSLMLLDGFLC